MGIGSHAISQENSSIILMSYKPLDVRIRENEQIKKPLKHCKED
jgi:hypothetical protein